MEPAKIDWKTVESLYVRDEIYEHINAPKWIDLAVPDAVAAAVDDEAWFCRPDCRHPKTAEDFLQRLTPSPKVKLMRSSPEVMPLSERNNNNHRDAALKRRGGTVLVPKTSPFRDPAKPKKFQEDLENQNPNLSTPPPPPPRHFAAPLGQKTAKEAIKSSAEKKEMGKRVEELEQKKPLPRLRSTLSARNLFAGKDILSQISEFCHELKKMATRKERNGAEVESKIDEEKKALLEEVVVDGTVDNVIVNSKNDELVKKSSSRPPLRVETGKDKWNVLREVRANPPTPQRFPSPSIHHPGKPKTPATTTSSPLNKPPKSTIPTGRGILQELGQNKEDKECNRGNGEPEIEDRPVDVFWFFKPCSYLV